MKVLCLIALIFATCAYFVNAQYTASTLTSGTAVASISTSSTNTQCNYYSLTVPSGTGAVQIDLTSTDTNYVSITTGFNSFPVADQDSTNNGYSYLFMDNNVKTGTPRRYFLCSYDAQTVPGTYSSFPTTSVSSGYCAAWVPNLHLGGKVYICLSSYYASTATTGISLTATTIATTTTTVNGVSGLTVPVPAATSSTLFSVVPYKIWVPTNSTQISLTTTSSSTVFQAPGLFSNAYTTGNNIYYGYYQVGVYYYGVFVQTSTSAQSFTFTNSFSSCTTGMYPYTYSNAVCLNTTALTSATGQALTYTTSASGGSYQLFQITAPSTVPAAKVYQLTVAVTAFTGTVYVNGISLFNYDTKLNAAGTFGTTNGGQTVTSGGVQSYIYHLIAPSSTVNIVIYSSSTSATTTLTATFANEANTNLAVGATTLSASSGATTATPATAQAYVTATPFTVVGTNGYLIKAVSSGLSTGTVSNQGFEIVSSDFKTIYVPLALQSTTSSLYTTYVPAGTLTSGSYYVLTLPSGASNARSVAFTVTSPSSSGSTIAPGITLIIAMIAFILLALN